jgi:hypothetical protein
MSIHESPEDLAGRVLGRRRFIRRREDRTGGVQQAMAQMHAELLLLREENARLKAERHRPADLMAVLGRARALADREPESAPDSDEAEQLLVECLMVRESLLEICREIEQSMAAFRARLADLGRAALDAQATASVEEAASDQRDVRPSARV